MAVSFGHTLRCRLDIEIEISEKSHSSEQCDCVFLSLSVSLEPNDRHFYCFWINWFDFGKMKYILCHEIANELFARSPIRGIRLRVTQQCESAIAFQFICTRLRYSLFITDFSLRFRNDEMKLSCSGTSWIFMKLHFTRVQQFEFV